MQRNQMECKRIKAEGKASKGRKTVWQKEYGEMAKMKAQEKEENEELGRGIC